MADKRKFSIFISSTYEDLMDERRAVLEVALESNYIPVGMEQFHAAPASQWDVITKMIDECDFYFVMIGGRYGSIDEATGVSYTEKEYDYAKKKGLPVLAMIRKTESITQNKIDTGDDWKEKQEKLEEFREKIKTGDNTIDQFSTIDDLKYRLSQTFKNATEYCKPGAGWIRYSDVEEYINEQLQKSNEEKKTKEKEQDIMLEDMKTMLTEFSGKLDAIQKAQVSSKEMKPITKEEIDKLFR